MAMPARMWHIPEGLKVRPDGSWRIGDLQVIHPATLRYLKSHLVFEPGGAYVVDGTQRLPVALEGPPFEVVSLVRDGRAQAVLSRAAHQTLLAHAGQEGGQFYLRAGERRLPVRA